MGNEHATNRNADFSKNVEDDFGEKLKSINKLAVLQRRDH